MNKQLVTVIAGAVLLFGLAVAGALAFIGGDDSNGNVHTMPGGMTMTGMTHTP